MKTNRTNQGFMVIEILVAASIITAAILSTMAVAQKSVYLSRQSLHTLQSAYLLEEGAEAVRIVRDNAWANISALSEGTDYYPQFTGGTWTLSATPSTVGDFTRIVNIESVDRDNATQNISAGGTDDPDTKLITVKVSWIEGGNALEKNLQFYLMNIFQ